jgi:uncharacterized protein YjiS (DUF1127 family)
MSYDGHTPSPDAAVGFASNALSTLRLWRERIRFRQELAARSERELQDIGTCWSSVSDEIRKPFWRD